jgi:hypothetical protein
LERFDAWLRWTRSFHLADLWEQNDLYYNIRRPKMEYWKRTNQTKKLRNSNFIQNNNNNLTLKHISGAFYTLVVCLVFCIVVFVQELIYFHQIKVQLAANRRRILQTKIRSGTKIIVKTNKTM